MKEHRVVDSRRVEFRSIDASLDTLKKDTFFSKKNFYLLASKKKRKKMKDSINLPNG